MSDKIRPNLASLGDIMARMGRPKKTANATPARIGNAPQASGETTSGYFRTLFKQNPKLLVTRSNSELLGRWLADHPGNTEVPHNVQKSMAKVKGLLRKKSRKRRKATTVEPGAPVTPTNSVPPAFVKIAPKSLEALEEQIDDCLTLAKKTDKEGLAEVIRMLRNARNGVVWMLGQ